MKNLIFSFILALAFIGCGGGGSSSSSSGTSTGIFIDNVVSGVKYINDGDTSTVKYTESNGSFTYNGGLIEFYIGNIKIGELNSLPDTGNVFVQNLVTGVEETDTSDETVLKIGTLLQSLDSDPLTDEIEISTTDFDKFNDISSSIDDVDVEQILSDRGFSAKSEADVERHITNTLKYYDIIEDNESPELESSSIIDGATDVSIDTNIELVFTDDIQKNFISSSNIALEDLNGNAVSFTISHYFNELTITPTNDLDYSTQYSLIIKDIVEDYGKNSLTSEGANVDTAITFTTTDNTDTNTSTSITHDGFTYNTITSPITGKVWLDRNLGATAVCTESRDSGSFSSDAEYVSSQESCFGDYYQWGRLTDGHEKSDSSITTTRAINVTSAGSSFVAENASPFDWLESNIDEDGELRSIQWSKTDGNSICPVGFRVPSLDELKADTINDSIQDTDISNNGNTEVTNRDTAFKNFLKLPSSGSRLDTDGTLEQGPGGIVWSSFSDAEYSYYIVYGDNFATEGNEDYKIGFPVRCVKDENTNPTANAGDDKTVIAGTEITFDGSSSTDSDGSLAAYEWKNGDTVLSTGSTFSKSDLSVGTHNITLIVTDEDGAKDFDQIEVEIVATSVTHDGFTYNTIASPITGKIWLDRNLGATAVCTKSRDDASFSSDAEYVTDQEACFGDYYQWGRLTDGHEKKDSGTTTTRATDITSAGVDFITNSSIPNDWVENSTQDANNVDDDGSLRTAQWAKTDGTSICPIGFRVPVSNELYTETTQYSGTDDEATGAITVINRDTAFKNFLKFPVSGYHHNWTGSLYNYGSKGSVWSNSFASESKSFYLLFSESFTNGATNPRSVGFPVRCIKD